MAGRRPKDPAASWVNALQNVIEALGSAGRPKEEVLSMLLQGTEAAVEQYYESIANQQQPVDGQTVPELERTASEPGTPPG